MHLITVHEDRFIAQIGTQSEPLGDLGEVHLKVNPDMKPCITVSYNSSGTEGHCQGRTWYTCAKGSACPSWWPHGVGELDGSR